MVTTTSKPQSVGSISNSRNILAFRGLLVTWCHLYFIFITLDCKEMTQRSQPGEMEKLWRLDTSGKGWF